MSKDTSLDALYDNTVNYYNQRPILNDAPRRKPATPTKPSPKVSEENAQMDLSLGEAVCGKRVLEVACGSGSQTDKAASVAESVLATDVTPNNIEIATQNVKRSNVTFMLCDAFDLSPGDLARFVHQQIRRTKIAVDHAGGRGVQRGPVRG